MKAMQTIQSIVHVAHYGNPVTTSFIQMMCALGRRLNSQHHRFSLVSSAAPGATWVNKVREAGIDLYVVRDASHAARMVKWLQPNIVHTHFAGFETATTIALMPSTARIFWHIHSSRSPERSLLPLVKALVKYHMLGLRVESFLAVSQALATDLVQWGVPSNKLRVLRVGIDKEWFRPPTNDERLGARRKLGIQDRENVILFFGRDSHIKGADFLTEALKKISSLSVIAVGMRSDSLNSMRQCNRVIGVDQTEDVRQLYWAADRLVMPSRWEGMPFTLLESLSCGLPALTSELACFTEVAHNIPGLVRIDVHDTETFAQQLLRTSQTRFPSQNALLAGEWSIDRFVSSAESLYGISA